MFKLSKRTEYYIPALQHLIDMGRNQTVTVREIAEEQSIPPSLLAKILQQEVGRHGIRSENH